MNLKTATSMLFQIQKLLFATVLGTVLFVLPYATASPSRRPNKILCLHGGGGSPAEFQNAKGMRELEQALPAYDFVYATGGYPVTGSSSSSTTNYLWIPDPPGGKNEPTTSTQFAEASFASINRLVDEDHGGFGNFVGVLGYSQGAAFVPVYLAQAPAKAMASLEFAMLFCGYTTETHLGLLETVLQAAPFADIQSLIWMGEQDFIIPPALSRALIPLFTNPTVVSSPTGGHAVPTRSDRTFPDVVEFVAGGSTSVDEDENTTPNEENTPNNEKEDCVNDPNFRHRNKKKRNCNWVRRKGKCDRPWKGKLMKFSCPVACKLCKKTCQDDPNFQHKNIQRKNCNWVARKKKCNRKSKGKVMSKYCPLACKKCSPSNDKDDSYPNKPSEEKDKDEYNPKPNTYDKDDWEGFDKEDYYDLNIKPYKDEWETGDKDGFY